MAQAMRAQYPKLALVLEEAARCERILGIRDGWWRVPSARDATDVSGPRALNTVQGKNREGHTMALLPYGNDKGRAYTRVDPTTGERTGYALLADAEGVPLPEQAASFPA
jgi:hypothetical protein